MSRDVFLTPVAVPWLLCAPAATSANSLRLTSSEQELAQEGVGNRRHDSIPDTYSFHLLSSLCDAPAVLVLVIPLPSRDSHNITAVDNAVIIEGAIELERLRKLVDGACTLQG